MFARPPNLRKFLNMNFGRPLQFFLFVFRHHVLVLISITMKKKTCFFPRKKWFSFFLFDQKLHRHNVSLKSLFFFSLRFRRGFKQFFRCCPFVHVGPEVLTRREVVTSRYSCSGSPDHHRIIRNGKSTNKKVSISEWSFNGWRI